MNNETAVSHWLKHVDDAGTLLGYIGVPGTIYGLCLNRRDIEFYLYNASSAAIDPTTGVLATRVGLRKHQYYQDRFYLYGVDHAKFPDYEGFGYIKA